jgi:hypothetical protein
MEGLQKQAANKNIAHQPADIFPGTGHLFSCETN